MIPSIIQDNFNRKSGKGNMMSARSILDFSHGPLQSSLRKCRNEEFNIDAINLYQKIQIILDFNEDNIDDTVVVRANIKIKYFIQFLSTILR